MTAALGLGVALAVAQMAQVIPWAQDAHVYYVAQPGNLYASEWQWTNAPYGYSPAFADALAPFRLLPERVFMGLWQLGLVAALVVTIRGWALPVLVAGFASTFGLAYLWPASPIGADIAMGNIHVLLGAVAVFGLRYPALWSFALLSKVTPGIGLLWFVARGEWRNLAVALGVTAVIAGVSFVLLPGDWFAWVRFLLASDPDFPGWVVPVPLPVRLAMSAALIVWGARTDRACVLPVACLWAIPLPYATMLAGVVCSLAYVTRNQSHVPRELPLARPM
jgi:hypothetical protein